MTFPSGDGGHLPVPGIVVTVLAVAWVVRKWRSAPRRSALPVLGWAGLLVFGVGAFLALVAEPEPVWVVPAAWTGLAVALDAAAFAVRGRSLGHSHPRAVVWLAVLSVILWQPFEWYNRHLAAWYRSGLPAGPLGQAMLTWAAACIWPLLLETADLCLALADRPTQPRRPPVARKAALLAVSASGVGCLALPVLVPRLDFGEHLLGLACIGFLLLLEPWNRLAGRPSLWAHWRAGDRSLCGSLALSGASCGLLLDGLGFWASSRNHAIAKLALRFRVFDLSILAYPLFALFGLQAYTMYVFAAGVLGLPLARLPGDARAPSHAGSVAHRFLGPAAARRDSTGLDLE